MVFANWRGFSGGMKGDWPGCGLEGRKGKEGLCWAEPVGVHPPRLFGDYAPSEMSSELPPEWENSVCFTIPCKLSEQPTSVIQVDCCSRLASTGAWWSWEARSC